MGEEEINLFYYNYKRRVYHIALSYVKDSHLAEDIAHEVLLKCYLNREKLKKSYSINSWLYKVTTNHCIDYLRSIHMKKVSPSDNIDFFLKELVTPEDTVMIHFNHEQLLKQITRLPPIYYEVIILFYFKYHTLNEIRDILNLNISTVKTRIHRGKKMLKDMFIDEVNL